MNSILKRKITDTLHLNNICKRLKSSIPDKNTKNINSLIDLPIKQNKHRKRKINIPENNNLVQTHLHHLHHSARKEQIPKRIREMVWSTYNGEKYSNKCYVSWCNNIINVFNYQVGHDIPESKGGTLDLSNLKPICGNCNLSMGNKYTITEWSTLIPSNNTNTTTTTTIDKQILEKEKLPEPKELIQSHINIMKTTFNNSKTITKSLTKIENILEEQKKQLSENTNQTNQTNQNNNKSNKFITVALLMVIIHILCI